VLTTHLFARKFREREHEFVVQVDGDRLRFGVAATEDGVAPNFHLEMKDMSVTFGT